MARKKMYKRIIFFTLVISILFAAGHTLAQNYAISWYAFAQGGGPSGSGNYGLRDVVGYGALGSSSSQNYGLGGGYLQVISQLGLNIYLGNELKVYSFPNPFNPLEENTRIKYFLPGDGDVDVIIRLWWWARDHWRKLLKDWGWRKSGSYG